MNSKYRDTVENQNYRYALWSKKHGEQPGILDENDVEEICISKSFFARKISLRYSKKLLSILGYRSFI